LGLTKIEDEEGSSAFLYGKDRQRDPNSFMTRLYPHLYTDHEKQKRAFIHKIDEKRKEIEEGERKLEKFKRDSVADDMKFNEELN
jgi:hypothetical protein